MTGRPFVASLEGDVYCCNICAAHLALQGDLLSKVEPRTLTDCVAVLAYDHADVPLMTWLSHTELSFPLWKGVPLQCRLELHRGQD